MNRLPETQFQLTKLPLSKLLNAVRYHFTMRCYSNEHKVAEFQILSEVRKESSRVEILDFWIAYFSLFRKLVGWIPWEAALKGKGAHESWQVFKDSILTAQEQSIPMLRKTSRRSRNLAWLSWELMAVLQRKRAECRRSSQGQATKQKVRPTF